CDLWVRYGDRVALRGVSFCCPPGVVMGVVGPNGAGKSSLLKALLGLVRPAAGEVRLFGLAPGGRPGLVAYVPQREAVDWDFPATVWDVAMMGRVGHVGWLRPAGREDRLAVEQALEAVGMRELAGRRIGELSGGQQQRVFLARALAQQAPLLLLDEPFTGVDAPTQQVLFDVMHRLKAQGRTVLVVHHDLSAARHYDLVLLLNGSPVAFGPPEQALNPDNIRRAYAGPDHA
ncbi:MAG TPA: metal ABC transporter ATP-binding protein, partial [Limnochordales bacterium]